jgi:type IV pilus secretin PilQ/predicted competence protein
MISHRNLPVVCSLLLVAGPAASGFAQGPLLPPMAPRGELIAQAAPPASVAVPVPLAPPATDPTAPPTPPPLDQNTPAPIAPPPVITGQAPGQMTPAPAVDAAAPVGPAANPAGPRAREFNGDDVGQVLRLLARQAKINLIVSNAIVGTINMRLEDVTALQAIEIICQSQGYDLSQNNGVYYVKTTAERATEPTQGDYYTFSYARATQVIALLTSQLKAKGVTPQVDERTNTVYYQEAKSNLPTIREFLARVDRPTKQVMIEARLVEVNANPRQSYGINWGGTFGSSSSPQTVRYAGSGLASSTVVTSTNPATGLVTTSIQPGAVPAVTTTTNGGLQGFDFLRSGNTNGTFFDALGSQFAILSVPQLSATLRFLNEDNDTEFLANPRIVTADNLEATIKIVRNQPVPQLNFNEQTATAVFSGFQDKIFGNTLVVKPSINKDNFITLSVKPEISNRVGDQVFNFAGAAVSSPIIDTRSLEANVLIKSGCTLAIGGLLQDELSQGRTKVPILGDIPVIGYLFQEHINSRTKRNLLIFVTPTIVNQQYGTGLEDQITGLKSSSKNEVADINGWRNNARGAIRIVKTPTKQLTGEYPVPGDCYPARGAVGFKESVTTRGD